MCIRDRLKHERIIVSSQGSQIFLKGADAPVLNFCSNNYLGCLLYTSDAADERSSVDLGGRRIIKKKNN